MYLRITPEKTASASHGIRQKKGPATHRAKSHLGDRLQAMAYRDPGQPVKLRLPFPLSVNRTRRIDWRASAARDKWTRSADNLVLTQKPLGSVPGQFQITIVLNEHLGGADLDNGIKLIIDYARRLELITDDSPKYMRRLIVEFGNPPEGCEITIEPWPLSPAKPSC